MKSRLENPGFPQVLVTMTGGIRTRKVVQNKALVSKCGLIENIGPG